jgi:hypothetical protein
MGLTAAGIIIAAFFIRLAIVRLVGRTGQDHWPGRRRG